MKRIAILFVLFTIVFGWTCCAVRATQHPIIWLSEPMKKQIWIDASFSKEEQDEIIRAYKTIECSTNYSLVQFDFIRNATIRDTSLMMMVPGIMIVKSTSADPRIKQSDKKLEKEHPGDHTVGLYLSQERIPTVLLPMDRIDKRNKNLFYKIVIHEGIHSAFNILTHSESTDAVMFYAMDKTSATDLAKDDLKYICENYQCDWSSFNICKEE